MIVCSCFKTTDREIRAAFGPDGDGNCPAGQGCGNCEPAVQDLIAETQRSTTGPTPDSDTSRPARS